MRSDADILLQIEETRRIVSEATPRESRSQTGQFLTPAPIARFMASLFTRTRDQVRILDAGAGAGALFAALVMELCSRRERPQSIEVTAVDSDPRMIANLEMAADLCKEACAGLGIQFKGTIHCEDFIVDGIAQLTDRLFADQTLGFTHAILNPPYQKINSQTHTRHLMNDAGLETTNLYAAFVWLSARLLRPGGEIVAITPRSFCNGPYFKRFRRSLLDMLNIRRIHLFESRKKAFADDSVLQENIIVHGIRRERQSEHVTISVSKGLDFAEAKKREVLYHQVVLPGDADSFIHVIEDDEGHRIMKTMDHFHMTLDEIGLDISTGRVVDFRVRESLRSIHEPGTVPLIYPFHFDAGFVRWPVANPKKPDAILSTHATETLLVEAGYYVLTKRFTAKEESRRVVASVYDPTRIAAPMIGFENHLNFFHIGGRGLTADLARGLAVFLNSSLFDGYFRLFSGHTQVNATDLRKMPYPSRAQVLSLGRRVTGELPDQETIDTIIEEECRG